MDQLFGTSNTPEMSLTPAFKGLIAKALFTVPQVRARYLARIGELTKENALCSAEAMTVRVDRLAQRLRGALDQNHRPGWEQYVASLKSRIAQRGSSIARQLGSQPRPIKFADDGAAPLGQNPWRFKPDSTYTAAGVRGTFGGRAVLRVSGAGGTGAGGTWRATALLDAGRYEFVGTARTRGVAANEANETPAGVMLRISGETKTDGITLTDQWKEIRYPFEVKGVEDVELVCEFRGPPGAMAEFDVATMKLVRVEAGEKAQ
jgi:hypothetical protein